MLATLFAAQASRTTRDLAVATAVRPRHPKQRT